MRWYNDEIIKNKYYRDSFLYRIYEFFVITKFTIHYKYKCNFDIIDKGYVGPYSIIDMKFLKINKLLT